MMAARKSETRIEECFLSMLAMAIVNFVEVTLDR